jgi:hypothetical protein
MAQSAAISICLFTPFESATSSFRKAVVLTWAALKYPDNVPLPETRGEVYILDLIRALEDLSETLKRRSPRYRAAVANKEAS